MQLIFNLLPLLKFAFICNYVKLNGCAKTSMFWAKSVTCSEQFPGQLTG